MNPFEQTTGYSPRNAFILALFAREAYRGPWTIGANHCFPCQITEGPDWRVIAFRGSCNPMDFLVDAEIIRTPANDGGVNFAVHSGFGSAWENMDEPLWKHLRTASGMPLTFNNWQAESGGRVDKPTYMCGHSAGGALATRCFATLARGFGAQQLYTFGEPRGGDAAYSAYCESQIAVHYRVEHRLDLVPRLPLPFGYRHSGRLVLIDNYSTIIEPSLLRVGYRDLVAMYHAYTKEFAPEIVLDLFRDHGIETYLRALHGFYAPPEVWGWINTTFPTAHMDERGDLTTP